MERPKIGLALGAGGARGFAHLGVIKVLQEEGIPIDMIAGSSMGALIGSFYGAGLNMHTLYRFATVFKRKYYLDFTVPKMGLLAGNRIGELIKLFTHGKLIEQLNIPIAIIAADLQTGGKVVFKQGPVADAVRASISIPGVFVPHEVNGRLLVDGGVVDRVPISVVKEMGADIVIAVDVLGVNTELEITSIYDVIIQSLDILQLELMKTSKITADVLIKPQVGTYSAQAFTNTEEIIKIGEEEAKSQLANIHESIERWKELN